MTSLAFLFPGQGSQTVGMGRALYDGSSAARDVFERADTALGWSVSTLCFEGPESELTLTANTQPALVATSVAALAALRQTYPDAPRPAFAAGHSLGEYSALVAAGALTLEDAIRVVHLRGQAMQEAVPAGKGAMAAIMGGDSDAVDELCRQATQGTEGVSPANYNAPGQVVIAGHAEAVRRAGQLAAERKLKVIPLKVSAPFHCSLMEPAAQAVRGALADIQLAPLEIPVVSNVEGRPNDDPQRARELLIQQIDSPVRWEQSVRYMADQGITRALEIGPGKVLAGLVRRTDKRIAVRGLGDPDALQAAGEMLS